MNRPALRRIILAVLMAIPTFGVGCNRQVAGGKPSDSAKPVAEERYDRILDSFRRKIEGQPVGFVVTEGTSRSTLYGTNKVTATLTPPAAANDHYKAVITVQTQSHYSLRRTKSSTEEAERDQKEKNQKSSALDDPKDKKGVGILEPDLAGKPRIEPAPAPKPNQPDEDVVTRRPDEAVRKYELVYDGDRWALLTKLDPKTEQSIQFAFDEALSRQ